MHNKKTKRFLLLVAACCSLLFVNCRKKDTPEDLTDQFVSVLDQKLSKNNCTSLGAFTLSDTQPNVAVGDFHVVLHDSKPGDVMSFQAQMCRGGLVQFHKESGHMSSILYLTQVKANDAQIAVSLAKIEASYNGVVVYNPQQQDLHIQENVVENSVVLPMFPVTSTSMAIAGISSEIRNTIGASQVQDLATRTQWCTIAISTISLAIYTIDDINPDLPFGILPTAKECKNEVRKKNICKGIKSKSLFFKHIAKAGKKACKRLSKALLEQVACGKAYGSVAKKIEKKSRLNHCDKGEKLGTCLIKNAATICSWVT